MNLPNVLGADNPEDPPPGRFRPVPPMRGICPRARLHADRLGKFSYV
jgi:hypothetical protein